MASNESFQQAAERIYHDWDKALRNDDVDALLELYAPDAVLESPAVPLTMGTESGFATAATNYDRCWNGSPRASRRCGPITGRAISPTAAEP